MKAFVTDASQLKLKDGSVLEEIESMARKVNSHLLSSDIRKMQLSECLAFIIELSKLLEPIRDGKFIDKWFGEKEPRPSRGDYPTTDQLGFIEHLVENLEQVVKSKADSLGPLNFFITNLQRKLRLVRSRLMEMPEKRKEDADLKDLIQSIADIAYVVEYVTDSFLSRDTPMTYCLYWFHDILKEFEHKETQVEMENNPHSIIASILSKDPKLHIIPVSANSDIRKRLNKVCNSFDIKREFSVLAWISVSSYKQRKKELLLDLIRNASCLFNSVSDRVKEACTSDKSEAELEELVYELFNSDSYFIILEDVEDIDVLNDITRFFPDKGYKSKILLTTRSSELVRQIRDDSQKAFLIIKLEDHTSTVQINKPPTDDDVVGFKEEAETMLEQLIRGAKDLCIISIVGMAGQGKTTLAKKLHNVQSVIDYFYTRAWCVVSQSHEKRELLLELLAQVIQLSNHQIDDKTDEELAHMLWKSLKGQRFLIILDDIWNIEAWNDLRKCFPNDNKGSRIILTTRLKELAASVEHRSILQPLDPLSDDESWELLRNKVFHNKSCPPELEKVGIHIAKSCKGLPLAVVLIAGVLAKMEREDQWKQIAETLNSRLLGAETEGKGIIELSYKHLPDHLKPCFLYFGAFSEDKEVPVWKLIRLWIAEGFVKHHPNLRSLEDVAENYLVDLIGRSLVTIAQEKSNGGIKSCRVHDLLHEFCLKKAEEEKFLQLIPGYDAHLPSSNDNLEYGMAATHSYSSTPIVYNRRRLCIYSKINHFVLLRPSGPLVRTLLFFVANDMLQSDSYDISFIFHNFKLLKILVLENIIGVSFEAIGILVHLRYLSVQDYVDSIPPSIANLWNLETFCVKALKAKVVTVPDSIWDMRMLRHVCINESASFHLTPDRLENSSILDNLQTISTPSLTYGDNMEKMMRKIRGIRKLKCIFLDSWDVDRNCNEFPVLSFLDQLESLKVFYNGEGKYPCKFNFPSNLKKLTLSNFRMPWSEISQLAMLCNLEVLKLLGNAFEGEKWEMEDEVTFPKLKFLKLDTLNVVQWSAYSDNFPFLRRLLLHKCKELEDIPLGIGDIATLEMIEVMWCNRSVAISARKIQEEQLEFGNEELKIDIHPKERDLESSS